MHKEKYGGHSHSPSREGIGSKIKAALHLDGKDKKEKEKVKGEGEGKVVPKATEGLADGKVLV